MKLFLRFMAIFVIGFFFIGFAHPVEAATYIMDNDPSGYNGTAYVASGSWTYGTYSYDYNGDHRITSSSSGEYVWKFNSIPNGNPYLYIWLANPNFTGTAYYYIGRNSSGNLVGAIDQYSAPSGWSSMGPVGSNNVGGSVYVEVVQIQGRIGADAIKITE
jgi:hypothetical protein